MHSSDAKPSNYTSINDRNAHFKLFFRINSIVDSHIWHLTAKQVNLQFEVTEAICYSKEDEPQGYFSNHSLLTFYGLNLHFPCSCLYTVN